MKKVSIFCLTIFAVSFFASCSSHQTRTRCRGNGSWSGKRNLSAADQVKKNTQQMYYAFEVNKEESTQN